MVLANLFDFRRNEPCSCGSERKYKKCCLVDVEEQAWTLGRNRVWVNPQMSVVLGLVAGLRPDGDEDPPAVEELVAAMEHLETELFAKEDDDDAWGAAAARYSATFVELLAHRANLHSLA